MYAVRVGMYIVGFWFSLNVNESLRSGAQG